MTTVHVILPNGNTYQTAGITASGNTTSHAHQATDNHEAVHVDDDEVKIDADSNHVIEIKKDLGLFDNYIVCRKANNTEVFSVRANGVVNTTGSVIANDLAAEEVDADEMFTDRLEVFNVMEVFNDADNEGTENDASRIVMTQPIYIQPQTGSNIPPTLNTSGSIAVQGAGKIGYVPTHPNGATIDGAECTLGRSRFIGDLSHDNDGLLLRYRKHNKNHKVLVCAEPDDPNIVIYSKKDEPYIQLVNVGPDEDETDDNIVFRVLADGDIASSQINDMESAIAELETEIQQLKARLDLLEN